MNTFKPPARPRLSRFYLSTDYQGRGPRVILMVGGAWTAVLRKHYGITSDPFYERPALPGEPEVDERGHPYGWVYKPEEVLLEEARWSAPAELANLKAALARALELAEEAAA